MKKLVSLALAAVCALAFATAVDAGTAIRMKAPTQQRGTVTHVNGGTVNIYNVSTTFTSSAQNVSNLLGGKYEVRSLFTSGVVGSQTIYDDLRQVLDNQYKNLVPAVANEATTIAMASVSTGVSASKIWADSYGGGAGSYSWYDGTGVYNLNQGQGQKSKDSYNGISNIASKVIPGRVNQLTDYGTKSVATQALAQQSSGKTMTKAEAEKYLADYRAAYEREEAQNRANYDAKEAQNANAVAAKVSNLTNIYQAFLADQAAALAIVQNDADVKAQILAEAESEYASAIAARQTAESNLTKAQTEEANALKDLNDAKAVTADRQSIYDGKVSARQTAEANLVKAQKAEKDAKEVKEAKEAIFAQAEADYNTAVANLNAFDYEGDKASLEAIHEQAVLAAQAQAQIDRQAAYDAALAAKNAAEDAYIEASTPTYETNPVVDEDGNPVVDEEGNPVVEKVEIAPDPEVVEAAFQALNNAKGALHTATINMNLPVDTTEADNAYYGGIGALDAQLRALQGSVSNTNANLEAARAEKDVAVNAYNEKVNARVDAETAKSKAVKAEETALKNLNNAKSLQAAKQAVYDEKVSAREAKEAALAVAQADEASAKAARDLAKKNSDDAAKVLADTKVAQANAKAAKLVELKGILTNFINSLKDFDGVAYNVNNIPGYNNVIFDQISYVAKTYVAQPYVEPQVDVLDDSATSSSSVSSITGVNITEPRYQMVDGVLTLVSTVNTVKTDTTIYIQTAQKRVSPLVLDIAGNGTLQASNGQHMPGHAVVETGNIIADFFGDGFEIAMEWVGPQDGLLVAPKADGSVDMSCLFGTAGGYENGYEKLSSHDMNDDMKITGDELNGLSIWQDANGNGIAEANELKTVKSLGITSINLDFNKDNYMSSFERNGQTYKMWDWWPNAVELIKVAGK